MLQVPYFWLSDHSEESDSLLSLDLSQLGPPSFTSALRLRVTVSFCCSWQPAWLAFAFAGLLPGRTQPQPANPREPSRTASHGGQSEGNGFDFLPLFTQQTSRGNGTIFCLGQAAQTKPRRTMHSTRVSFEIRSASGTTWWLFGEAGDFIWPLRCSELVLTLRER